MNIEIRRNGRLATVVGAVAALLALAFWVRGDGVLDVLIGLVLAVIAAWQLWSAWDARTPILVGDRQGVRIRLGRVWTGLPWESIDEVEYLPRASWWRDGRLVLLPYEDIELPRGAARHAGVNNKLYGVPFAVPLGLATTVVGGSAQLDERLAELAGERTAIVRIDPSAENAADDAAVDPTGVPTSDSVSVDAEAPEAAGSSDLAASEAAEPTGERLRAEREDTNPRVERPVFTASPTPSPLREPVAAVRVEVTHDLSRDYTVGANALKLDPAETDDSAALGARLPEADELRPSFDGRLHGLADRVVPIATAAPSVEPIVIADDAPANPAPEPVIGPELAAARTRIGLSVDQLAERTRIRPHVIEAIEVDDFGPCGGDFYARGHLRTLTRVLGLEAAPLLAQYDERYAAAPVDPRRIFEAELATGSAGSIRRLKGGPNWSVLVAAVMAVVLAWSVARLVMDGSSTTPPPAISLESGSGGTSNPYGKVADPVKVVLTAAGGGSHVVLRDAAGDVVFSGDLAFGQTRTFRASPPLRIQASDGSTEVAVDGAKAQKLGTTGEPAQKTLTAR